MATDSPRGDAGIGEAVADPSMDPTEEYHDPEVARLVRERQAEVERIVARRKPELIQLGIQAYLRDLPRLLAENRSGQLVAYRGNDLVAFGGSYRKLRKRLAKKGFTDWGELYVNCIAPLDIDEEDELEREPSYFNLDPS
jgi:hypothetical protein